MRILQLLLLTVLALFATVAAAQAGSTDFANPKQGGNRLDYCFSWQKGCGQQAADAFCQSKGHVAAFKFSKAVGVGPTRVLGTGQMCDDKTCDGFTSLSCTD